MRSSSAVLKIVKIAGRLIIVIVSIATVLFVTVLALSSGSFAAEQQAEIPDWLKPDVGEGGAVLGGIGAGEEVAERRAGEGETLHRSGHECP